MKSDNTVQIKSYAFAVRIVKLCQHLADTRKEYVLSRQLLKSGTSIGANIEEAIGAQSRPDFAAKMTIAYKEARETCYWLRLLRDTDYLPPADFDSLHGDAEEQCRIVAAIQKTVKSNSEPA